MRFLLPQLLLKLLLALIVLPMCFAPAGPGVLGVADRGVLVLKLNAGARGVVGSAPCPG